MLRSNESVSEQAANAMTWVANEPESRADLLPESTNDALLAELQGAVETRKGTRKAMLASTLAGFGVYVACMFAFIGGFWASARAIGLLPFLLALLVSLCFAAIGMYGSLRIGRDFYRRRRERLHQVIPALAERGDVRLLPHLLGLMDMRYSGVLMWQESRPVFLKSLETLLTRITPDQFHELSPEQVRDTITMLYFPDGGLRAATAEAVVRCGDRRTLEALKKVRLICTVGSANYKSLFYRMNPAMRFLQKEGVPMPTVEAREAMDHAIAGLTERLEQMRRDAQLLRASDRDSVPAGRELVRAANSPGAARDPEQLVRATDTGEPPHHAE